MRMNMSEEKLDGFSRSKSENFEDENGVSDPVSDPDLVEASDSESEISDAEKRRKLRRKMNSRRQNIEDLAEAFDMNDDEKKRTLELVADLMPDTSRMSRADDISERLSHGFEEMRSRHPKLLFNRKTRNPIDITNRKKFFAQNETLAGLIKNEESILRAIVVNDRVLSGINQWVTEHESIRSMLLTEMVRRSTLSEQWRHMLPKFMLPLYAMIFEANVGARDLRVNGKLFNRIRDTIIEWSDGSVSRDELMTAARQSEEEFISAAEKKDFSDEAESMDDCRNRLKFALQDARADADELSVLVGTGQASDEDVEAAMTNVRRLKVAIGMDGGIDAQGRLVFESVDAFAERSRVVESARKASEEKDAAKAEPVHTSATVVIAPSGVNPAGLD